MITSIHADITPERCDSFFVYMDSIIERLRQQGRMGSAKNYRATLKRLSSFRRERDLQFADFSSALIEDFTASLRLDGVRSNSISFYLRILRTVYLRAVEQGITEDSRPFRHAYTKIEKTIKRAVDLQDIRCIKELDLPAGSSLDMARDIFMFLFYTRGMSFIDAAFLRKSDVKGNEIVYCRNKTHRPMVVGMNRHIQEIITKYSFTPSPFLLPIITDMERDLRLQYENALRRVNNSLKRIAMLTELPAHITTYTARHSWATIAKMKGVPTATISDALGHDSEKTTQIYLASISTSEINRANDLILEEL